MIHHGTHLEGNPLSKEEVKDVLAGEEVLARDRDIQEILNYREVLKFIDSISSQISGQIRYIITIEKNLRLRD